MLDFLGSFDIFTLLYSALRTLLYPGRTRILYIPSKYVWANWEIRKALRKVGIPCWGIMLMSEGGKQLTVPAKLADEAVTALAKDCWHSSNQTGCLAIFLLTVIVTSYLAIEFDINVLLIAFNVVKEVVAYLN